MKPSRLAHTLFATLALCALGGARAAPGDRPVAVTPRQFRPRRVGSLFQRRGQGRGLWQIHASPRTDVGRQANRHPDEPRHALLGGGVRSRCGSGDHRPARSGQALPVDAGDRRRRIFAGGRLRRGRPYADKRPDRHALRPSSPSASWSIRTTRRTSRRSTRCRMRSRSPSPADPGPSRSPIGTLQAKSRCGTPCSSLARPFPTPKACSAREGRSIPVRHLIGSAVAWGGNPEGEALYLNVTPAHNDGKTIYKLTVKDVPVEGFWSISVYDDKGHFVANPQNAYSLNNLTAKSARGRVVRDPVRRLRRLDPQLPAHSARRGIISCASIVRSPRS